MVKATNLGEGNILYKNPPSGQPFPASRWSAVDLLPGYLVARSQFFFNRERGLAVVQSYVYIKHLMYKYLFRQYYLSPEISRKDTEKGENLPAKCEDVWVYELYD